MRREWVRDVGFRRQQKPLSHYENYGGDWGSFIGWFSCTYFNDSNRHHFGAGDSPLQLAEQLNQPGETRKPTKTTFRRFGPPESECRGFCT
jgi:hypothetical protein